MKENRWAQHLRRLLWLFCICSACPVSGQTKAGWYTEGKDFAPARRVRVSVKNPLSVPLKNQPVCVRRRDLPVQDVLERSIAIVDPLLAPNKEPDKKALTQMSGYLRRKETNGHAITLQIDDLDKDGIWDEIVFMTDLAANETRDFYVYMDFYERGMFAHQVHAGIGNYGRHTVPFWESEEMGWKLWYPHDLDLHGKRKPMLTAYYEYSTNNSGYYMPFEMGTDIMTVAQTFGAGGMCIFERPERLDSPARAWHSPFKGKGPLVDTRFAFDVVCNGPLRSVIRVKTMNWNSGRGFYELEQSYTVYAGRHSSEVEVRFSQFQPPALPVSLGAGIRRIMSEYKSVHEGGIILSMGKNVEARIPDEDIGDSALVVPWQGIGIIVKDAYRPVYTPISTYGGNHLFRLPDTPDHRFEYMVLGGWSFGETVNSEESFLRYAREEATKYNHPPVITVHGYETK